MSAIMPTRGRPGWAMQALRCFTEQSYPNKELIIVDDLDDRSFDVPPELPSVHYSVRERRESIPTKRNICCSLAHGQIVMHWDSDDYSCPDRMMDQVLRMEASEKQAFGYHTMPFFDEDSKKAFLYVGHPMYAVGTSLCYTRAFWKANPFIEKPGQCEDNTFVFAAKNAKQITTVPCERMMVARIHKNNTTAKHAHYYKPIPVEDLAQGFFA